MKYRIKHKIFPQDDEDFEFTTERITPELLNKIDGMNPVIGFHRFMSSVFEHPQNVIIKKKSPNVGYSEIRVEESVWNLACDKYVLPIVLLHMASAALGSLKTFDEQVCNDFRRYVSVVIDDPKSKQYSESIKNLKFAIINRTR